MIDCKFMDQNNCILILKEMKR